MFIKRLVRSTDISSSLRKDPSDLGKLPLIWFMTKFLHKFEISARSSKRRVHKWLQNDHHVIHIQMSQI